MISTNHHNQKPIKKSKKNFNSFKKSKLNNKCNFQKCMDKNHPCSKKPKRCIDYLDVSDYITDPSQIINQASFTKNSSYKKIKPQSIVIKPSQSISIKSSSSADVSSKISVSSTHTSSSESSYKINSLKSEINKYEKIKNDYLICHEKSINEMKLLISSESIQNNSNNNRNNKERYKVFKNLNNLHKLVSKISETQ